MHGGLYCLHDCMDSRIDHIVVVGVVRIGVLVVRIVVLVVAGVVVALVIG